MNFQNNIPEVIAEIGVNHDGSIDKAMALVDLVAEIGLPYAKFQVFQASKLVHRSAGCAPYQLRAVRTNTQIEMLDDLAFSFSEFEKLAVHCEEVGVQFVATPFDEDAVKFLADLQVPWIKVASGELTNYPLLRCIANTEIPVVLSTGMSSISQISKALDIFRAIDRDLVCLKALMHCVSLYPTPTNLTNLRRIISLRKKFGVPIGYSDHTIGIEAAIIAGDLGVNLIEKHFTNDRSAKGPDHKASSTPEEFKALLKKLVANRILLGDGEISPSAQENEMEFYARRVLIATTEISAGDVFGYHNLSGIRANYGLPIEVIDVVSGTVSQRSYLEGEIISL
ncbi:N-acetylneuraminate synthase family protein [Litorivicinus sp.]|nr:N-acetylneuraminate synthase family protein [Litorivicinus sp.]